MSNNRTGHWSVYSVEADDYSVVCYGVFDTIENAKAFVMDVIIDFIDDDGGDADDDENKTLALETSSNRWKLFTGDGKLLRYVGWTKH